MKKILASACCLIMTSLVIAQSSSLPTISFAKEQYFLEEGKEVEICVTIKNIAGSSIEEIIVVNKTTDSEFLSFQSKSIPVENGTFCFTVEGKNADGNITYANVNILELQVTAAAGTDFVKPISTTSIILDDDVSSQSPKDITPVLIKGFDNNTSQVGDFSLSIVNTVPLVKGSSFVVSNSNFSTLHGWVPKTSKHEFIKVLWEGDYTISPGSIICITKGLNSNGISANDDGLIVMLNGEVNIQVTTVSQVSSSFLSHNSWSNIYLLSDIVSDYDKQDVEVYDGITYGISAADFPFDIPFIQQEFQLFFSDLISRYYGYVNCSVLNEICDIIEYIKNLENWVSGEGTIGDELSINEICTDLCDIGFCPTREVLVEEVCYDQPTDIIFILDESGSIVNNGEFEDIKSIVKSSSIALNCLSDSLRFAVACFNGTGSFHIIQNFMEGDVNIDSYLPPPNQSTDVSDAYSKLLLNLESSSLTLRDQANFQIILLTDAIYNSYLPYTPFNQIKDAPYYAENIVVYFEDLYPALSQAAAAATASKGGEYNGTINQNTGDPEGAGGPRHLYVYESIDLDIASSIASLANCNELSITLDPYMNISSTDVIANNGGQVISQSGTGTFLTNGIGGYSVGVRTEGPCEYSGSFDFDPNDECLPPPHGDGWEALINDENQLSRHESFEQGRIDERNSQILFDANVMPVPARDYLNVLISNIGSKTESKFNFQIYSSEGKLVEVGHWNSFINKISLDGLTPGLYTLRIQEEQGQSIIKKFVVIKF